MILPQKKFFIGITDIKCLHSNTLREIVSISSPYVQKCPDYLHLSWLGTPSVGFENKIKASVEKSFFTVEQRVMFTSRPLLPLIKKDVLPVSLVSNVVYNFLCYCDSRYVGHTSQRLQDRIH